jgi:hypothetical protein
MRLYSRYRESVLKFYIFMSRWTKTPVIGKLVRGVANLYGNNGSTAYLLTLDEAEEIVDISEGLALGPCDCRSVFMNCDNPINTEIMVRLSRNVFIEERPHNCREITRQEAKDVLRQCHQMGLIPTIVKCRQDFYAIGSCCLCCCVPLRLSKQYGIGNTLVRSNNIVREFKQRQLLHEGLKAT